MQTKTAEMIHHFRRKRNITQQHLADVLGVSVGTVSKWENGITVPDISLLMDIAAYFKTSVDVLIGYRSQSVTRDELLAKLKEMRTKLCDDEVVSLCAMAEDNFPNDFEVIYACGLLMELRSVKTRKKEDCEFAKKYLLQSIALVAQNQDPHINTDILFGEIGQVEITAGNKEEGVALLEKHNAGGIYDIRIAHTLLSLNYSDPQNYREKSEKAMDYISGALLNEIGNLIMIAVTWFNAAIKGTKSESVEAKGLVLSIIKFIDSLYDNDGTSPFCKYTVMLYGIMAVLYEKDGDLKQGEVCLLEACERAKRFDNIKHHDSIRYTHFLDQHKPVFADDFGESAMDGLVSFVENNVDHSSQFKEIVYGMQGKNN